MINCGESKKRMREFLSGQEINRARVMTESSGWSLLSPFSKQCMPTNLAISPLWRRVFSPDKRTEEFPSNSFSPSKKDIDESSSKRRRRRRRQDNEKTTE